MTRPSARAIRVDILWASGIFLLGLALRLAVAHAYGSHPLGQIAWVDEEAYRAWAWRIANGQLLPDRPFFQDPLLAYLIAALMQLLGTTEVASLRLALAVIGSLTPVVTFIAGQVGFNKAAAIVASLIVALYGPLVFADACLEKEGPAALLTATALTLTMLSARSSRRLPTAALAGAAWGLLALLRANALAVAPILAGILAFAKARDQPRRSRWSLAGTFLAGFALALAPVSLLNATASRPREFILTTWQAGANFFIGNGPEANGTYLAPPFVEANPNREADDFLNEARRRTGHNLSDSESSQYWFRQGLQRWTTHPSASFRLLVHKFALLLHRTEIPDNQDAEVVRIAAAPILGGAFLHFGLLLPLAAIGLGHSPRTVPWRILGVTVAVGLGSTALFFVVGRYRLPWIPPLALLAGVGAVDLLTLAKTRRWGGLAWRLGLLGAPAAFLAWHPTPDPAPDRWGHAQIGLASAYLATGELDPAIDALDDASALGPGVAARVAELCRSSALHDQIARLARPSRNTPPDPLRRARHLRHLPEFRQECGEMLKLERYLHPEAAEPLLELAAWSLGQPNAADARRDAQAWLARPSLQSPLKALLSNDLRDLPPALPDDDLARTTRLRLARASLNR